MKKFIVATIYLSIFPTLLSMDNSFLNEAERTLRDHIQNDNITNLKSLLNSSNINTPNKFNKTPLHIAAYFNSTLTVILCLSLGADTSRIDGTGNTALSIAINNNYPHIIMLLKELPTHNIQSCAQATLATLLKSPDTFSQENINTPGGILDVTPLMYAAMAHQSGDVFLLLNKKANPLVQLQKETTIFDMLQVLMSNKHIKEDHRKSYALIWQMCSKKVAKTLLMLQKKIAAENLQPIAPKDIWLIITSFIIGRDILKLTQSPRTAVMCGQ